MKLKILIAALIFAIMPNFTHAQNEQFDKYGGWAGLAGEKTGFFHTEEINGKWWIITPEGNAFWSIGMYCVRISGIPEEGAKKRPYKEASLAKYGSEGEWAKITKLRLKNWGFNTIGDWSSESIYKEGLDRKHAPLAYVIGIDLPRKADNVIAKGAYGYFPDVFSEKFKESVKKSMQERFKNQPYLINDSWLLGYFLADEPSWYGSKQRRGALVNDFIALSGDTPGKTAWVNFVKKLYSDIRALNNSWNTGFNSFDDLYNIKKIPINENSEKDNLLFFKLIAEEFSRILHDTLREFDANHMILGTRPSRLYPELVEASSKYSDIFSTSGYGFNQGHTISKNFKESMDKMYENAGKPIMLGVIITAEDAGLPYGMVGTQKDRGVSYWRYMAEVAKHPAIVGMHWFQYFDPPKKCYDERAANWGLVNQKDEPYEEAVKLIAQANKMVYAYALGLSTFKPEFDSLFSLKKENSQEIPKGELKEITIPIKNSGFEKGKEAWKLQAWKGNSKAALDSKVKHSGRMSLKIEGGEGEGWDSIGVATQKPDLVLLPGYDYKLSAWIKANAVESEAFVRIKTKYKNGETAYFKALPVYGTKDWNLVEAKFSPKSENAIDYLVCQLTGGGTAWFDDISLTVMTENEKAVKKSAPKNENTAKGETHLNTTNLPISNAGFEEGDKGWKPQKWNGKPSIKIDARSAHSGRKSAMIKGSGDNWKSTGAIVKNELNITLNPDSQYILSGWIKAKDIESEAFIRIKVKYKNGQSEYFKTSPVYGSAEWSKVSARFSPKPENTIEYLACQLVGRGTAWFDDIKIEEIMP
ncbi:MAG: hypothetical protein COV72_02910 [Candidatus Omnitrophica bacterium CG11_big_fil_rev_8_21_14_0_20_42_13]|uniref:CBM-cenC domain-containing protein n=1 Tax=Candidatus Ghiorseimicrobium undicola TaxID=1974746 RepID=A0A2H0LYH2_9BACT|nr:MAG: hypothetical protein COV72_02910 [Candidatus Omnitrophica bacterium CG11_big_fil_rev_8_21_14_0_20_42_13]